MIFINFWLFCELVAENDLLKVFDVLEVFVVLQTQIYVFSKASASSK